MSLSDEKIQSNWETFTKLCSNLGDRTEPVAKMLTHFEERAATAPASTRKKFHAAYPGGLVDHSLRVLSNALKLIKAFNLELPKESIVIAALFHDWGKVGSLDSDYYLPQESDWHREKLGEIYKINELLQYMPNNHRTIWLFNHFGIKLSEDEFLAILLNDGPADDANKRYSMKEPMLAVIIHQADRLAAQFEKDADEASAT